MGTNFLHGKKTYTTATLILVGATQVGIFSCLLTLTGWKRLHYTSIRSFKLFKVVVLGAVIQKRRLNRQLLNRSFWHRFINDVMINAYLIISGRNWTLAS